MNLLQNFQGFRWIPSFDEGKVLLGTPPISDDINSLMNEPAPTNKTHRITTDEAELQPPATRKKIAPYFDKKELSFSLSFPLRSFWLLMK